MTLKTPTLKPSASALPLPIPELNTEEKLKFESLLKVVKSWREIPSPKGKQGPITESEIFWLTQECLLRYLRATKWDLAQSEKRLLNTLTWRRDFGVDDITGDIISSENETGKQVLVGYDNLARPCYYMFPGRQNSLAGPKQVQHVVYMMERVIDLMVPNQEKVIILIDFKSSSKIGPNISQAREILDIIQTHYPERLGMALIQNTPWVVSGFFKLISPFIDSTTREKLNFNQDVTSFVPTEQLCKEFKGSLDFEYDHEVYWPTLVKICKDKKAEQFERWTQAGKCYGESEAYLRGRDSIKIS